MEEECPNADKNLNLPRRFQIKDLKFSLPWQDF